MIVQFFKETVAVIDDRSAALGHHPVESTQRLAVDGVMPQQCVTGLVCFGVFLQQSQVLGIHLAKSDIEKAAARTGSAFEEFDVLRNESDGEQIPDEFTGPCHGLAGNAELPLTIILHGE